MSTAMTGFDLPAAPPRERRAGVRVLHVINGEDYSGAERVQDLLALRLGELGYDVGFACVKPGLFDEMRIAQSAPLSRTPMRSAFDLRPVRSLARLVRKGGYQIVHTHSVRNVLVGAPAARLAGVPLVHHVHCQTAIEVQRVWLSRLNALVEKVCLRQAAAIVAVSASCRDYLLESGYRPERISLVPNGVPAHAPCARRRAFVPCEASAPPQEWVLGIVALFRPRKGLEVALDALAQLRAAGLPVRLRAIGRFQSAEYEREIKQRTAALGLDDVVDWRGFQQNVCAELAALDLFLFPSLVAEAMPMTILEAMAAEVPIVASRVAGVTDLVRHLLDGLLVEPANAADLAEKVAQCLRGEIDLSAMRSSALARQESHFSDRSMAEGVAGIYQRVLAESSLRPGTAGGCEQRRE